MYRYLSVVGLSQCTTILVLRNSSPVFLVNSESFRKLYFQYMESFSHYNQAVKW